MRVLLQIMATPAPITTFTASGESDSVLLAQLSAFGVELEKFDPPLVCYRGTHLPPETVFAEGFSLADCPFFIETSDYRVGATPEEKAEYFTVRANQYKIDLQGSQQNTIAPGTCRGLVSTSTSAALAANYVVAGIFAFLKGPDHAGPIIAKAAADFNFGYVYAVRVRAGINTVRQCQWASLDDDQTFQAEAEIASTRILPDDVLGVRTVQLRRPTKAEDPQQMYQSYRRTMLMNCLKHVDQNIGCNHDRLFDRFTSDEPELKVGVVSNIHQYGSSPIRDWFEFDNIMTSFAQGQGNSLMHKLISPGSLPRTHQEYSLRRAAAKKKLEPVKDRTDQLAD